MSDDLKLYIKTDGKIEGPFPLEQARLKLANSPPGSTVLVSFDSEFGWVTPDQIPGIRATERPPPGVPGGPPSLMSVNVDLSNLGSGGQAVSNEKARQPVNTPKPSRQQNRQQSTPLSTPALLARTNATRIVQAGAGARATAILLDGAIFGLAALPMLYGALPKSSAVVLTLILVVTNTIFIFQRGQTLGKWALGLCIVDVHEPTVVPFFRIYFLHYILWIGMLFARLLADLSIVPDWLAILLTAAGFGILLADIIPILGVDQRRMSERIAGTRVILVPEGFRKCSKEHVRLGSPVVAPMPLSAALILALVGFGLTAKPLHDMQQRLQANTLENPNNRKAFDLLNSRTPFIGPKNAPVHVVEFGDFTSINSREQHPRTKALLVHFSGNIRYNFHAIANNTAEDSLALGSAKALQCASLSNKRYPMKDWLFRFSFNLGTETYNRVANMLRLDKAIFRACMKQESTKQAVTHTNKVATDLGVKDTPTFFVNNQMVIATNVDLDTALQRKISDEMRKFTSQKTLRP